MPKLLAALAVIGTAGDALGGMAHPLAGADELGWTTPYHLVHELEHLVADVGAIGGVLSWLVKHPCLGAGRLAVED